MKILFVAMTNSIHTTRWVNQLADMGWDVHLFPSTQVVFAHPELRNVTIHFPEYKVTRHERSSLSSAERFGHRFGAVTRRLTRIRHYWHRATAERFRNNQAKLLADLITRLQPDTVHSLEFQHAGYVTLEAKRILERQTQQPFPVWAISNWGSDIYLFGRLRDHQERIRALLAECDYYFCECQRDVDLARAHGLRGKVMMVVPVSGGLDLDLLDSLGATDVRPSERKIIVLKGYQHWAGRALIGIKALELCADLLQPYDVVIYSTTPDVEVAADLLASTEDLSIRTISQLAPISHAEMLKLFGCARVYIGLSISDGISNSMLEAIAMGAFPIQSNTACADEWFTDEVSGFMVPPEEPAAVANALRAALTDDELVNRAAQANQATVRARLAYDTVQASVVRAYQEMAYERVSDDGRTQCPLVSVITPAYNQAAYLRETIESVLAQKYPNFEYIVMDDGSTDNTRQILEEYAGRIKWESHPNMGEASTVNKGFGMAAGKYVVVVNGDDPVLPGMIQQQVEYLESHPDILATYSDWMIIDEHSRPIRRLNASDYSYPKMIARLACYPGPAAMITRTALDIAEGRRTQYRYIGDLDFWFRLGEHGDLARLPVCLGTHRTHPGSAGVASSIKVARELELYVDDFFGLPGLPSKILRLKTRARSSAYYELAARCEDPVQQRHYLLLSLRTSPLNWAANPEWFRYYHGVLFPWLRSDGLLKKGLRRMIRRTGIKARLRTPYRTLLRSFVARQLGSIVRILLEDMPREDVDRALKYFGYSLIRTRSEFTREGSPIPPEAEMPEDEGQYD